MSLVKGCQDGIEYRHLCTGLARELGTPLDRAALIVCYAIYHGIVWDDTFSSMLLSAKTLLRPKTPHTKCFVSLLDEIKSYSIESINTSGEKTNNLTYKPDQSIEQVKFPQIPPKYKGVVEKREKIIKQWTTVPPHLRTEEWCRQFSREVGFSIQTISSWVRRYLNEGIEGLVPNYTNGGRPRSFSDATLEVLEECQKIYLGRKWTTIKGVYSQFVRLCEQKKAPIVSYSTFLRFVKNISASDLALAKKGSNWWKQHFRPSLDTFKDAILPLQVVEMDNTPFDVFPVDSNAREPLATPHLVAALDVYSRMITGYYLTFDHPSRLTALEVLTMTMLPKDELAEESNVANPWPIEGLPVMILVDNGMDYRAGDVKKFCRDYNIILEYAPVRTPEYKANIEQWFEILKKDLKNEGVPGFRPSLELRKEMPETDPIKFASLTLHDLNQWLTSWILDTYHERTMQKGHVPSPLTLIGEAKYGRTSLPLPSPVTLSPQEKKNVRFNVLNRLDLRVSNRGITKAYLQYNSTELQAIYQRKGPMLLECRFDPRDIREMFVINPDSGEVVIARPAAGWGRTLLETFGDAPLSEVEWARILKFTREKNRGRVSPETLKIAENERRKEVEAAAKKTRMVRRKSKRERREEEIKTEHARTVLYSCLKSPQQERDGSSGSSELASASNNDLHIPQRRTSQEMGDASESNGCYKP